jgi:hypothetical protein
MYIPYVARVGYYLGSGGVGSAQAWECVQGPSKAAHDWPCFIHVCAFSSHVRVLIGCRNKFFIPSRYDGETGPLFTGPLRNLAVRHCGYWADLPLEANG